MMAAFPKRVKIVEVVAGFEKNEDKVALKDRMAETNFDRNPEEMKAIGVQLARARIAAQIAREQEEEPTRIKITHADIVQRADQETQRLEGERASLMGGAETVDVLPEPVRAEVEAIDTQLTQVANLKTFDRTGFSVFEFGEDTNGNPTAQTLFIGSGQATMAVPSLGHEMKLEPNQIAQYREVGAFNGTVEIENNEITVKAAGGSNNVKVILPDAEPGAAPETVSLPLRQVLVQSPESSDL